MIHYKPFSADIVSDLGILREKLKDPFFIQLTEKDPEWMVDFEKVLNPINPFEISCADVEDDDVKFLYQWKQSFDYLNKKDLVDYDKWRKRYPHAGGIVNDIIHEHLLSDLYYRIICSFKKIGKCHEATWTSLRIFVDSYIFSLFSGYLDKENEQRYFPGIKLWNRGLVPLRETLGWSLWAGPHPHALFKSYEKKQGREGHDS